MTEENAQNAAEAQQQFTIEKIYIRDVSFESPNAPQIFNDTWEPNVNLQLNTDAHSLDNDHFEVVLTITVTVKSGEKTSYLIELQQAGIFTMKGFAEQDLRAMLGSFCPNILFPYARETVAELSTKGGFPPLHLAPVNFDALYAQHLQQQTGQEQAEVH